MTEPSHPGPPAPGGASPDADPRLDRFSAAIVGISRRAQSAEFVRLLVLPASLLICLGFAAIVAGWWGVAHQYLPYAQLPYLVSGGLLGLALVALGGMLLSVAVWSLMLQRAGQVLLERMERLLAAAPAPHPGHAAGTDPEPVTAPGPRPAARRGSVPLSPVPGAARAGRAAARTRVPTRTPE